MLLFSHIKSALLIVALTSLSGTQAAADIKARQVWDGLRAFMTSTGFEISSIEARVGTTIQVRDLMLSKKLGQSTDSQIGFLRLSLAFVTFTQTENKTVSISLPDMMRMQIQITAPDGKKSDLQIEYRHKINSLTVTEQSQHLLYSYTAETAQIALRKLIIKGLDLSGLGLTASMDLNKISASSRLVDGTSRHFAQALALEKLSYVAGMVMPETALNLSGDVTSLDFTGETHLPVTGDGPDIVLLEASPTKFNGNWHYSTANFDFTAKEVEKSGQYTSKTSTTVSSVALVENQLSYTMASTAADFFLRHADLPFPIALAMARISTHLTVPLGADTTPKAYALRLDLSEFVIPERMWSIFDSNTVLPRDPATLTIDLSGSAKVLVDLFTSDFTKNLKTDASLPVEVQDLALERFHLSGAGTKVTGVGAFRFDNSDLLTVQGIPRPEGQLDIEIDGVYGLMDRLIEIGLIQKSEAVGVRMMLSMLTVPGSANDVLKTRLEVTKEGHFIVNGQRLR
jgi:hypothetical protein